jgi:hypothetical protein
MWDLSGDSTRMMAMIVRPAICPMHSDSGMHGELVPCALEILDHSEGVCEKRCKEDTLECTIKL